MFANRFRSQNRTRTRRQRKSATSRRRFRHRLTHFESLEDRRMLSGTPSISIDDVTVNVDEGTFEFIDVFAPRERILDNSRDMVIGPDGNLYISSTSTDSVLYFNALTGRLLGEFVTEGSGVTQLSHGAGVRSQ